MGCSEAFRGKANSAKHPRNVTSQFGTPRNILGENMTRPGVVKKCTKNTKIEGYYTSFSKFLGVRAPNATRSLLGVSEIIGKKSCGLERIYLDAFTIISGQFWVS